MGKTDEHLSQQTRIADRMTELALARFCEEENLPPTYWTSLPVETQVDYLIDARISILHDEVARLHEGLLIATRTLQSMGEILEAHDMVGLA
jgi:hypothetical protein